MPKNITQPYLSVATVRGDAITKVKKNTRKVKGINTQKREQSTWHAPAVTCVALAGKTLNAGADDGQLQLEYT